MKIGILGTGNVAKAIGSASVRNGFHVMFGSRTPGKAVELGASFDHYADGGSIIDAIHFGEIVILAVPYKSVETILRSAGSLRGKILVDCTNPLLFGERVSLALGHSTSAAEQIAAMAPEARVVKAFNTAFAEHIEQGPYFGPNDGTMFYCGDDAEAKKAVARLIEAAGFEPIDAGPLDSARMLEPMAALIIRLAINEGMGRELAFKLLQR